MSSSNALACGVAAVLTGVLAYAVAVTTPLQWAAAIGTLAIVTGLVIIGAVVVPARTSFRAGPMTWQNDGLP